MIKLMFHRFNWLACLVSLVMPVLMFQCSCIINSKHNSNGANGDQLSSTKHSELQKDYTNIIDNYKEITLKREFLGRMIEFNINPEMDEHFTQIIWEEKFGESDKYVNKVEQISSNVLMYSAFPVELKELFYKNTQPTKLEFLDSISYNTLKTIDIWNERPFRTRAAQKITYYHFNAEEMLVVPYENQTNNHFPTEFSVFTHVENVGNHIIVKYKELALNKSTVIGQNTVVKIYDKIGNLVAVIDQINNLDQAVISPKGLYMIYTFGGKVATVNQPFARLEKPGWGLMELQTKKVVYSEFEKEGTHLDGINYTMGLLRVTSTTPFDKEHYDYSIFFDEETLNLYKKFWLQVEWDIFKQDLKSSQNKDWRSYFNKYDFEIIKIK